MMADSPQDDPLAGPSSPALPEAESQVADRTQAPAEARGALIARFTIDARGERGVARLRSAAALLALAGALALFLARVPVVVFMVAVLAAFISLAWLVQAKKARRRAHDPERHYLAVHARGLCVADGPSETWQPWDQVTEVDVDEERLDIVLSRRGLPPLRVEPRYPGVAIHDLMRTLRNAWRGSLDS